MSVSERHITTYLRKAAAAGFLLVGCSVIAPGSASAECNARFTCDPGVSPRCWFSVFDARSTKTIIVPAGQSQLIYGVQRGDTFCTSNQGVPNPYNCGRRTVNMSCN
jgi:hypothetical protein